VAQGGSHRGKGNAEGPDWVAAEELVPRARAGDTLAMNELLDIAAPYVRRICATVAPQQVDDATQEALVIAFRRLGSLRDPSALRAWLRTVAVRESLSAVRAERKKVPHEDTGSIASPDPGPALGIELRESLGELSPEQRAVLVLRDLEGLPEREIAPLLRIAPGTVKSRLHRARERFRRGWTR
jgi:RNA polymerase sigma factor (sigma-70 family)